MKVSVIIPNYNGKSFVTTCLDSLKDQSLTNFEVIFVDNGSIDGSSIFVKTNYPTVKVIELDENYGFSYAVNIGIKNATGKFVVLLNTDTEATHDWLFNLVECIETNDNIFSCASKMIQFHNKDKIDDAGDWYSILGWAYQEGHSLPVHLFNENRVIFSSCAGAAIYRKEIFEEIGYFDESFFAYLEDVDIGYRALINGYQNIYCAAAKIYHIGSATSGGGYNKFKVKLSARNSIYLPYKNMPVIQLFINLPFLTLGFIVKYLFFLRKGFAKDYIEGVKEGLYTLKIINRTIFKVSNIKHYFYIQLLLVNNTFRYLLSKLI